LSDFNRLIDSNHPARISELFTENGTMTFPGQKLEGKQAIYDFYRSVEKDENTIVRHTWSNLRIVSASPKKIEVKVLMHSVLGNGTPPILPNGFRMGDGHDVIVIEADGCLRFESRHFALIFQCPNSL